MIKLKDLLCEADSSLEKIERHFLKKLAAGVEGLPDDLGNLSNEKSKEIVDRLGKKSSAQLASDLNWLNRAEKVARATKTAQASENLKVLARLYAAAIAKK